ncbi:MAG: YkgJ family cysteine cluster protein, partial [Planctomycetota bacterium]
MYHAAMSSYMPTMRPDVVLDEEGDAATLRCPRTGHQLPIEQGWERRLIRAADGTRSVDALMAAAVKGPGEEEGADDGSRPSDPRQALHFIKTLRYLRLLADTDETMLQAIERARSEPGRIAEAAPFRTLPGAKFGCHLCGACCRNQRLGPIQDEDVQRLEALPDLEERFPLVRTSGRAKKNPGGEWFLPQRSDGRCAYLQDDNLCGLHAHYSPETKPAMCHLFPTSAVATVFGAQVFDRADCESYGKSAFDGTPYQDRAEQLKQALTEVVR